MSAITEKLERPQPAAIDAIVRTLTQDYGERAVVNRAVREQHGHGEGMADSGLPDVVVFPHSNEEVAAIVRHCHLIRIPVIAAACASTFRK